MIWVMNMKIDPLGFCPFWHSRTNSARNPIIFPDLHNRPFSRFVHLYLDLSWCWDDIENFLSSLIDFPVPWSQIVAFYSERRVRTIAAFIYPSYCAKSLQLSNFAKLCHCYSNLSSEQYYSWCCFRARLIFMSLFSSSQIPILIRRDPGATQYQYPDITN